MLLNKKFQLFYFHHISHHTYDCPILGMHVLLFYEIMIANIHNLNSRNFSAVSIQVPRICQAPSLEKAFKNLSFEEIIF